MKKIIFFVFVLIGTLFIFGTNAKAGEDNLNVNIKSITLMEKSDNAEVLSEPSAEGLGVNSNVKFLLVGDYVTYKITIHNKDDVNYTISLDSNNEYFTYTLSSNVVKANSDTDLLLTIKYEKLAPQSMFTNEQLIEQSVVSGKLTAVKNEEAVVTDGTVNVTAEKEVVNPNTSDTIGKVVIYVGLLAVTATALVLVKNTKKKMLVLTLFAASLLCMRVNAEDAIVLEINSKIFVQGGLVYNGEVVHKSSFNDKLNYAQNKLEKYCLNQNVIEMETPEQQFGDFKFVAISESAARVTVEGYLSSDLDVGVTFIVTMVTDPVTGDSHLESYDYNFDSSVLNNIDYTKLIYNNKLLDREGFEEMIDADSHALSGMIMNLGYDCNKKLFGEPQVISQQEI